MAGTTKSLFQRLQERRAAVEAGDPTAGETAQTASGMQPGRSAESTREVRRETAPGSKRGKKKRKTRR